MKLTVNTTVTYWDQDMSTASDVNQEKGTNP